MDLSNFALFTGAARGSDASWSSLSAKYGVGTRTFELFNVPRKLTGNWIPSEFVGQDKANRLIALMEQVFIKAVNN